MTRMNRSRVRNLAAVLVAAILLLVIAGIAADFFHEENQPRNPPAQSGVGDLFGELGIEPITSGDLAPDFALNDVGGKRVRLRDLKGKVVFLNFWATWCPPCVLEMPTMEKLHQQYARQGLAILAINFREAAQDVERFLEEHELTFTTLLDPDGKVFEQYRAWSLPFSVIIDRRGHAVGKALGYRNWHRAKARQFFEGLLAEK